MDEKRITAQDVLGAVLQATETQREAIQNAVLDGLLVDRERPILRKKLLELTEQVYPPGNEQGADESVGWTRTWLFSLLAIVCDEDQPARECLLTHLDPDIELNQWVSYWLLYGLILAESPLLKEATDKARNHKKPLVSMLSRAVAVQAKTETAQQDRKEIEEALASDDWDTQWAALRALRWVKLQDNYPKILQALCKIVDDASNKMDNINRGAYDAIIALGYIQPNTEPARQAAEVLDRFVSRARRHPQRVPERRKAISALGWLGVEKVDLLLDELIVDDPTMAREAARALEKMLDTPRAAERIFEKVQKAQNELHTLEAQNELRTLYTDALRWMDNQPQVISVLERRLGSEEKGVVDVARDLMRRVGGALAFDRLRFQRSAMDNFTQLMKDTQNNIDDQFNKTIAASRAGFRIQTWMDRLIFGIGLIFISASAIKAFSNNTESAWAGIAVTGGVGLLGVLYSTLIARPRENIKEAVLDQSQLQMIFLDYVRDLNRVDQAYIEHILEDEPLSAEEVQKFVTITNDLRTKAIEDVNKLRTGASNKKSE